MKNLINTKAATIPALPEINQRMDHPFSKTEQRQPCDQSHQEPMNCGVSCQPPLPGKGDIAARALLHCHAIALQTEIAEKVAHGQQSEQFRT